MLPIRNEEQGLNYSWYIINPNGYFAIIQNTQIQLMTWITVILTPMLLTFDMIDDLVMEEKQAHM